MKNIQEAINKNKMKKVAKALSTVARKDKKVRFIQDQLNSGILPKKEIMNLKGSVQDEVVMAFVQEVGPDDMIKALNIKLKEQIAVEACWDGYKQAGMKKKKGKMVPNCVPEEKVGAECSCCGNKINKEGKCGCGSDCEHCGGQHDIKEAKYAVDVEGMPRFYVDADSTGKVKVALRKLLKRDSMIKDIERSTDSKVKQDYRQRISQESVETNESVNVKSIDKFKAATRDIGKNKDIDSQSIADALSKIVTAVRMLDKSTSGRTDVKYEKVISKESTRINNIVNKLNYGKGGATPEGKEIVKLLNKHGLNRPFRTIIFEGEEMNEQFVVKYAKSKRGIIYQAKFKTQPEAEKFLAQKRKEGMNGIVSKDGKPTSMQRFKDMQKESVELEEALQHVHTIKIDGNAPNNPKPFEVREIKDDFKTHVQAVRSAIKSKGGLVTDTETPSKSNNYVGWIMVGTRGDASKIDAKSIEKAVKRHGVEIHGYQFESVELEEKMNTIDIARNVVKNKSAKHGLDMQTANLILQVYGKVNDKNKRKMEVMAPSALGQAVWKMTK